MSDSRPQIWLRNVLERVRGEPIDRRLAGPRKELRKITAAASVDRGALEVSLAADRVTALVALRELAFDTLGLRPYDVQLLAALCLDDGRIVQMQTGEGKTLAAALAAVLGAKRGRRVHILTFNDYLARRDAEWMGPLYAAAGLRVAAIQQGMSSEDRREAWAADITYATAREAGFDLLRDELQLDASDRVRGPLQQVIVDEADSILVDEARIPLVLAGRIGGPGRSAADVWRHVVRLSEPADFATDEHRNHAFLTPAGVRRLEAIYGDGALHGDDPGLLAAINVALRARVLLQRDVDYIVRAGRIELVDAFTGRAVEDRRWPDGLQAALQAKEGLEVDAEGRILCSITQQHLLQRYETVSAMTATAVPAAREMEAIYGLTTAVVPSHRPSTRTDEPDRVYATRAAKEDALLARIAAAHGTRRPVLVGTASVEESERLSARLQRAGVACVVLNARNDEDEAAVVAAAGEPGRVTVSTNMAGRGTDIKLGGEDESGRDEVVALGGLLLLGTNRHESRRTDDQLRGRAGRQGDPGTTAFLLSLEDPLLVRYGLASLLPSKFKADGTTPLEDPAVGREVARVQRIVEGEHFEARRTLYSYSDFADRQRQRFLELRDEVLGEPLDPGLIEEPCADLWQQRVARFGRPAVEEVARQLAVRLLDLAWVENLESAAAIREGIHLRASPSALGMGSMRDPVAIFRKELVESLDGAVARFEDRCPDAFSSAELDEDGALVGGDELSAPGSTWTYVRPDDPFADLLTGLGKKLGKLLKKATG
jgi:preprotein translocase subunit SecA